MRNLDIEKSPSLKMALRLFLIFFFGYISPVFCAKVQNYDRCTLWLKTDGTSCQAGLFYNLQKFLFNYAMKPEEETGDTKCCDDGTGCYTIATDSPWECHFHTPDCISEIKPEFIFFTPEQPNKPQIIDFFNLNDTIQKLKTHERIRQFFVVTHGFGGSWPKPWQSDIKDKLVALKNNVMMVKWIRGSSEEVKYFKAAANTRAVGKALSMVVKGLVSNKKVSLNSTTLVGFSLGAHTSGYAGSNLPGLRRIIALDPAGPLFQCMSPKARLDPSDAKFVIVVHTNGDYFLMNGMGTLQPLGHMDIYANGGAYQPGCIRGVPEAARDLASFNFDGFKDSVDAIKGMSCNHNKAPYYLTELLIDAAKPKDDTRCKLVTFPCGSTEDYNNGNCFQCPIGGCPVLSYFTDINNHAQGKFYFGTHSDNKTNGQYCGRQVRITLQSDVNVKGSISINIKGNGRETGDVVIQDMYSVLVGGYEKNAIMVLPWEMETIEKVDLKYMRNKLFFTGGPTSWKLESFIILHVDGTTNALSDPKQIRDGALNSIKFS